VNTFTKIINRTNSNHYYKRYLRLETINADINVYLIFYPQNMKLEVEVLELTSIIASLGKSSRYFEEVVDDKGTADWLMRLRHKLIEQAEEQGVLKKYFTKA
jgi:hypothetical protein